MRRVRSVIVLLALVAAVVAGCGSSAKHAAPATTAVLSARCLSAPAALVDAFAGSLNDRAATLGPGEAVRVTNEGGSAWLVAAALHNADAHHDVAVWTVDRLASPGVVYAADYSTEAASGLDVPPGGSMVTVDGYDDVVACAKAADSG